MNKIVIVLGGALVLSAGCTGDDDYVRADAAGGDLTVFAQEIDPLERRYIDQLNAIEDQLQAVEEAAMLEDPDDREAIFDQTKSIRERSVDTYDRLQAMEEEGQDADELEDDVRDQIKVMRVDIGQTIEDLSPRALAYYQGAEGDDVTAVGAFGPAFEYINALNDLRYRVQAMEEAAEMAPEDDWAFIMESAKNLREKHVDTYNRVLALQSADTSSFAEMSSDVADAIEEMRDELEVAAERLGPRGREEMQTYYEQHRG